MHECYTMPAASDAGFGVDKSRALAGEVFHGLFDVHDSECNVMQSFAVALEESPYGGSWLQRLE